MRRHRGLGQTSLPDISQLPEPGDLQGQLAQGSNLLTNAQQAISSGNPTAISNLLSAGVTMAQGWSSSTAGVITRDIITIGAATAVGAAGGPIGAAAGLIVSSIEVALQSIFGGGPTGQVSYPPHQPTQGAQNLAMRQAQWIQQTGHLGQESLNPQGWTFYDYLSRKYPPSKIGDADAQNMWTFVLAAGQEMGTIGDAPTVPSFVEANNFGFIASNSLVGNPKGTPPSSSAPKWQQYRWAVQPVCTPVIWDWMSPTTIQDCTHNQWFGSNRSVAELYGLWQNDSGGLAISGPSGSLSVAQIMAYAEKNRPNPMFYASDLYVGQQNGDNQVFTNLETLTGLSTAYGMLAIGAGCQSLVSELLLQQKFLHDLNGSVPPLFRALVEEYLAKARAERANMVAAAPTLSTGVKIGAFLGGALGLSAVAILAYSAATRTSPVTVTKAATARAGRLFK